MSTSQLSIHEEVKEIFVQEDEYESSEDPPWEEWSSLLLLIHAPETNVKKVLAAEGLYDPGSGEICAKYVKQSDSSILRHPYYKYPCIEDPGINEALYDPEPEITYDDDGQDLYLAICKEMGQCPCMMFYRQMLEEHINLKYYGINPWGVRPMCLALKNNRYVKFIDFTDNHLSPDGCYHLGQLIKESYTLEGLNLYGCKIGVEGIRQLMYQVHYGRVFKHLNLAHNDLGDNGMKPIAKTLSLGTKFTDLNLSYNNITGKGVTTLCEGIDTNNNLKHLDLSWNTILMPKAVAELCLLLSQNPNLEYFSLSWNSMNNRFANALKTIFLAPKLKHLDLSNNQLKDEAILVICKALGTAKKLETLNMSGNPMSMNDARRMCSYMKLRKVKVMNLFLDNITVNEEFIKMRKTVMSLKHRQGAIITHGEIRPSLPPLMVDMRELILRRMVYICSKPKKKAVKVPLLILKVAKQFKYTPVTVKELLVALKKEGAFQVNEDLIEECTNAFPGPKRGKTRLINLELLVDYIKRRWPDVILPPTPPPEPEPVPLPSPKGKEGKGADKGKPGAKPGAKPKPGAKTGAKKK